MWGGVEGKLHGAAQHWVQMGQVLYPPRHTGCMAAMEAQGVIIGGNWQHSLYIHVNGFLTATRSVPWIIEACFGADTRHQVMRAWFKNLPAAEQARRQAFSDQFKPLRGTFDALPLTDARDQSLHRAGFPPVEVTVRGNFGKTYTGGPDRAFRESMV